MPNKSGYGIKRQRTDEGRKNIFKEKCAIDDRLRGMPNIPDEYLPDFKLVVNKAIIPSDEEIEEAWTNLCNSEKKIDFVISHCAPTEIQNCIIKKL